MVRAIDKGPRVRVRGEYGTPEFEARYQAALRGQSAAPVNDAKAGSLAWLIEQYRDTSAWRDLSLATRRQRENILKQVIGTAGRKPFAAITEADVLAGRDRRQHTPFQARHFIDSLRGLFKWAVEAKHVKVTRLPR